VNNLSPAAQAVWEAFNEEEAGVFVDYGQKLAAALEALADQSEAVHIVTAAGFSEFDVVLRVSDIHAIANELKAD
jgi:hypothetical protein